MIYRAIKITNKKPIIVNVPESWDDVTFKQLRGISEEKDAVKRVSVLTDIPVDFFNNYPEMADFYVWLENKLSWSNKWEEEESEVEVFILEDETFSFPKDVGMLSVGLYKDIQNEAHENQDDIISIYPLICASYYQLLRDKEYDYLKAKELVELFDKQPCKKVFNAANFFLSKVEILRSGTKVGLKDQAIRWIKNLLASMGFQKYSGLKLQRHN